MTRACRAILRHRVRAGDGVLGQANEGRRGELGPGHVAALDQHVGIPREAIGAPAGRAILTERDHLVLGLHAVAETHPASPEYRREVEPVPVRDDVGEHPVVTAVVDESTPDVGALDRTPVDGQLAPGAKRGSGGFGPCIQLVKITSARSPMWS